jgi:arylformamidase
MYARIVVNENLYQIDFGDPIDLSIPLIFNTESVNCFYAPLAEAEPVRAGAFTGSIEQGGSVNFMNVKINPHGNGTHTETVAHIHDVNINIREHFKSNTYYAVLISVYPTLQENGDKVITVESLRPYLENIIQKDIKALIIRTLPNMESKCWRNYSGTNPVYLSEIAVEYIVENGIEHLLVDLPSIDKEDDEGKLLAHKMFWQINNEIRWKSTITELIFVPDEVADGMYMLQIHTAPFVLDVSPSRPIIYKMNRIHE